jgi:hypothetical protein
VPDARVVSGRQERERERNERETLRIKKVGIRKHSIYERARENQ